MEDRERERERERGGRNKRNEEHRKLIRIEIIYNDNELLNILNHAIHSSAHSCVEFDFRRLRAFKNGANYSAVSLRMLMSRMRNTLRTHICTRLALKHLHLLNIMLHPLTFCLFFYGQWCLSFASRNIKIPEQFLVENNFSSGISASKNKFI